jgi:hypothetical protein
MEIVGLISWGGGFQQQLQAILGQLNFSNHYSDEVTVLPEV